MIDAAVAALRAGLPVVIPTDTVYGLAVSPHRAEQVARLYRLKGRVAGQPTALLAHDIEQLLEYVPELRGRPETIARALLPGPFTLVLPNPKRRFSWLTGGRPETIGIRVPDLTSPAKQVLEQVGAVAATSANLPGGPDPRRLDEVPTELLDGAAAVVDGGDLPGRASTVLDLTSAAPAVLREGAVSAAEALARVEAALAEQ